MLTVAFCSAHCAYGEGMVYSGAIIRVRNSAYSTKAFDEVDKGLPNLKFRDMQVERVADGTIHLRKRSLRSTRALSSSHEQPKPVSRKTNACYRAKFRRILKKLGQLGHVSCEPNYALFATTSPNDPYLPDQYASSAMSLPAAWDTTTGSNNLVVVVIDTGVDYYHDDLLPNIWINPGEIAANGIDDDANGVVDDVHGYNAINNTGNSMDDHGHGTHCAGILGASGNNGLGIAGVAWNVKIAGAKFLSSSGSGYTSDAIKAIDWATNLKLAGHNVILTSNSWGGGGYSQSLADAITRAANAGLLFVAAAGNSSLNLETNPSYPASYTMNNIISVASTTNSDTATLSGFSNYGAVSVDIAAPGSSIISTYPSDSYSYLSGTSMAAPQISGIAVLAQSVCNGNLTYSQVRSAILASGSSYAALSGKVATGALANAAAAVSAAQDQCGLSPTITPTPTAGSTHTSTPTPTPVSTPTPVPEEPTATPSPVPTDAAVVPTVAPTNTPNVRLDKIGFKISPNRLSTASPETTFAFYKPVKANSVSVSATLSFTTRSGLASFTCSRMTLSLSETLTFRVWAPTALQAMKRISLVAKYNNSSKEYNQAISVVSGNSRLTFAQARKAARDICADLKQDLLSSSTASRSSK